MNIFMNLFDALNVVSHTFMLNLFSPSLTLTAIDALSVVLPVFLLTFFLNLLDALYPFPPSSCPTS